MMSVQPTIPTAGYAYRIDIDEAGRITWSPPEGSQELVNTLAIHFPKLRDTEERMSMVVRQYIERKRKNTSNSQHTKSPSTSQNSSPSREAWIPPNMEIATPINRLLLEQSGNDNDDNSITSTASLPRTKGKGKRHKRQYGPVEREEVRRNRINNWTCEYHRQKKTKCDRIKCQANGSNTHSQAITQPDSSSVHRVSSSRTSPTSYCSPPNMPSVMAPQRPQFTEDMGMSISLSAGASGFEQQLPSYYPPLGSPQAAMNQSPLFDNWQNQSVFSWSGVNIDSLTMSNLPENFLETSPVIPFNTNDPQRGIDPRLLMQQQTDTTQYTTGPGIGNRIINDNNRGLDEVGLGSRDLVVSDEKTSKGRKRFWKFMMRWPHKLHNSARCMIQ